LGNAVQSFLAGFDPPRMGFNSGKRSWATFHTHAGHFSPGKMGMFFERMLECALLP
jgi:hypothetical protein